MAGLCIAAALAAGTLGGTISTLAERIAEAAGLSVGATGPGDTDPGGTGPGGSGPSEPIPVVPDPGAEAAEEIGEILEGDDPDSQEIQDILDDLTPAERADALAELSDEQINEVLNDVFTDGTEAEQEALLATIAEAGPISSFLDSDTSDAVVLDAVTDPDVRRSIVAARPEIYLEVSEVTSTLNDAWTDSNPGTGTDPDRAEQGGWIVLADDGTVSISPWPSGAAAGITPTPAPSNALGAYHTHPNLGPGWQEEPSPADVNWTLAGDGRAPHYVVSDGSVWVIDADGNVTRNGSRTGTIGS